MFLSLKYLIMFYIKKIIKKYMLSRGIIGDIKPEMCTVVD